jgi:hypothetical protein
LAKTSIFLPSQERRVLVRAFWLTVSCLLPLPWIVLDLWTAHIAPAVMAAVVAGLAAFIAFVREDLAWRVYRAWNRRLVRPLAAAGSAAVLAICYSVVVVAAKAGAREDAVADPRSSWVPRRSLPIDAYPALFDGARADAASAGWIGNYIRWAKRTHNLWAISLLPFLAILKLLSEDEPQASHANIYTLF